MKLGLFPNGHEWNAWESSSSKARQDSLQNYGVKVARDTGQTYLINWQNIWIEKELFTRIPCQRKISKCTTDNVFSSLVLKYKKKGSNSFSMEIILLSSTSPWYILVILNFPFSFLPSLPIIPLFLCYVISPFFSLVSFK